MTAQDSLQLTGPQGRPRPVHVVYTIAHLLAHAQAGFFSSIKWHIQQGV